MEYYFYLIPTDKTRKTGKTTHIQGTGMNWEQAYIWVQQVRFNT